MCWYILPVIWAMSDGLPLTPSSIAHERLVGLLFWGSIVFLVGGSSLYERHKTYCDANRQAKQAYDTITDIIRENDPSEVLALAKHRPKRWRKRINEDQNR